MELERRDQHRAVAKVAYQRWLKNKQEEDTLIDKERARERELNRLKWLEKESERKRTLETFKSWKEQKDLESRLHRQLQKEGRKALTPPPRSKSYACISTSFSETMTACILYMNKLYQHSQY